VNAYIRLRPFSKLCQKRNCAYRATFYRFQTDFLVLQRNRSGHGLRKAIRPQEKNSRAQFYTQLAFDTHRFVYSCVHACSFNGPDFALHRFHGSAGNTPCAFPAAKLFANQAKVQYPLFSDGDCHLLSAAQDVTLFAFAIINNFQFQTAFFARKRGASIYVFDRLLVALFLLHRVSPFE
jgi:hypothetical protein